MATRIPALIQLSDPRVAAQLVIYNNNDTIHKKIHKNPETDTAYVTWVTDRVAPLYYV